MLKAWSYGYDIGATRRQRSRRCGGTKRVRHLLLDLIRYYDVDFCRHVGLMIELPGYLFGRIAASAEQHTNRAPQIMQRDAASNSGTGKHCTPLLSRRHHVQAAIATLWWEHEVTIADLRDRAKHINRGCRELHGEVGAV